MRRRSLLFAGIGVAAALAVAVILGVRRGADVRVITAEVTRGVVARSVMSTGTFEPVNAVEVGSEVSGTISALEADFNSRVRTGQVIARLDPAASNADVTKAEAALAQVQANATRLGVIADDARAKLAQARALAAEDLVSVTDLEAAQVKFRQAEAEWKAEEAAARSARAALRQARVNRDRTIIRSPIDGVVVQRHVEVGQTVAASLQSPAFFTIADLSRMQLLAKIHETEIGDVQPGTPVTYEVESLPGRRFEGTVAQVRLQPSIEVSPTAASGTAAPVASQPVPSAQAATPAAATAPAAPAGAVGTTGRGLVSYTAIIDVDNRDRRLAPGNTAIVMAAGRRHEDVVRIPNSALTFRPAPDVLAAVGQKETPVERPNPSEKQLPGRLVHAWKYENGRFDVVALRVGPADLHWTAVLSGAVRPGDRLVTQAVRAR